MKKQSRVIFFMSILAVTSVLTSTVKGQLFPEFGIKGGANLATLNNADGVEAKLGFLAGGYVNLKIPGSPIAIQPEVLYVQYGATGENTNRTLRLGYIQVPILVKFGFSAPLAPVKPTVFLGPYIGYNTNAEAEDVNGNLVNQEQFYEDVDFGVVVGAGIDISKFRLALRYTAGLTSVFIEQFDDGEKNGALAITVGIAF